MKTAFLIAIGFVLFGCGNEPTGRVGEAPPQPAGEAASMERFSATGHLETKLYLPAGGIKPRTGEKLPITVTDGDGFRLQLPGELAGERIFLEIDGVAREVLLDAQPGDTLFLSPR